MAAFARAAAAQLTSGDAQRVERHHVGYTVARPVPAAAPEVDVQLEGMVESMEHLAPERAAELRAARRQQQAAALAEVAREKRLEAKQRDLANRKRKYAAKKEAKRASTSDARGVEAGEAGEAAYAAAP